uniref:Uncharacterized protein n=1 Tax=Anopheles aquasalis TaxID=42839 RepID=T1DR03_ANOAQ
MCVYFSLSLAHSSPFCTTFVSSFSLSLCPKEFAFKRLIMIYVFSVYVLPVNAHVPFAMLSFIIESQSAWMCSGFIKYSTID